VTRLDPDDARFMRLALAEAARGLAPGELPIGAALPGHVPIDQPLASRDGWSDWEPGR